MILMLIDAKSVMILMLIAIAKSVMIQQIELVELGNSENKQLSGLNIKAI